MSDHRDVAAMFGSKHSVRILHRHGSSVDSVADDSEVRTLSDVEVETAVPNAPTTFLHPVAAVKKRAESVKARLSLEEMKHQLEELEHAPAPTKEEIQEMLTRYAKDAESSDSDDSVESSSSSSSDSDIEPTVVIMKVLVIGNARCGKTSTIRRFIQDEFSDKYVSTIGADFVEKIIKYDEHLTISLQLWDIAGQDRFAKFTRGYFREAKGAVIVCDITRANTIDAVVHWKNEIDSCCKHLNNGADIPVIMIANKSDLLVDPMGALDLGVNLQKCVEKNNIIEWFRASAKSGQHVKDAFQCLLDRMVEDHRAQKEEDKNLADDSKTVNNEEHVAPEVIRLSQTPRQYRAVKQKGFACDCH